MSNFEEHSMLKVSCGQRGVVIILEGLIGAGKTSFAQLLAECMEEQTLLLLEPDEREGRNPYLADYYTDPDRWSFAMQMHLLSTRLRMHLQAQWRALQTGLPAILDRSFYGDTAFARLQLRRGHLSSREYETYRGLYHAMTANVLLPQFCIWLDTTPETSARRVQHRMEEREGRRCESVISLEYLEQLHQEISHMLSVLESMGVHILRLDWNEDRDEKARKVQIEQVLKTIQNTQPHDLFLDLHRRTI